MKHFIIFIAWLALVLALASCRTSRSSQSGQLDVSTANHIEQRDTSAVNLSIIENLTEHTAEQILVEEQEETIETTTRETAEGKTTTTKRSSKRKTTGTAKSADTQTKSALDVSVNTAASHVKDDATDLSAHQQQHKESKPPAAINFWYVLIVVLVCSGALIDVVKIIRNRK